jgi:CRISPR-associated protein Cas2
MPKTTEVLISYDIEDNKTRTKLCNKLRDVGMITIQKSVMWGRLIPADIKLAKRILQSELEASDRAFLLVSKLTEFGHFYGSEPEFSQYDDHAIY